MTTSNVFAFLDTIAWSELGGDVLRGSDDGYNVLVGSTPSDIRTFSSYSDHPRTRVWLSRLGLWSSAAGRYQIRADIFDAYKKRLALKDFGHAAQDAIAEQLLLECRALDDINAGRIEQALYKCSSRWASLPGSTAGQHIQPLPTLIATYCGAGGTIA